MPFIPRLPTFNQNITIHRLQAGGIYLIDALPTACQFYFGQRNFQLAWIDETSTDRDVGLPGQFQASQYNIFLLVAKTTIIRDPLQVRTESGIVRGARDFFTYANPNFPVRTYWIDQVEPRWPGFPNEHKIVVATQRGYNP